MTDLTSADRENPSSDSEAKKSPHDHHKKLMDWMSAINIADDLDESELGKIGLDVKQEYDIDVNSRADWLDKSKKSMDLAMQVSEVKQYPWPKASNIIYPLMTTAAIQFAARAYPAIIQNRNVVRGCVIGDDSGVFHVDPETNQITPVVQPGSKATLASKIGEHMSWQLLDEMTEWEEETDKLLHILPIAGCCFRKSFYDSAKGRNSSLLVSAERLVINYHAKSIETAPRLTEELTLYPVEILEQERAGVYKTVGYSTNPDASNDPDAPQVFLEQHRWLDLDDDGFPEPYIVTVHREMAKVVRIVARYDHDGVKVDKEGKVVKIDPIMYYTKYDFLPNPEGGIYGVGFGQLLRPINEGVNTSLNMLVDAGHLANTGGGFIGKGLSMHTGTIRFLPGEYKAVNVTGQTVKENIVPLTFPGPSPVLFNLLGTLIEAGKEIAAVKDVLTGEGPKEANQPATTTLALIEQGLKVFTAIYKRIHRALKKELDKLYKLNAQYLPEAGAGYRVNNEWKTISRADYVKGSGVEPMSDPSMVSDMQKLGRAQFLMTFAQDPMMNGLAIRKRMLDAANIEKPEELINSNPPPDPQVVQKMKDIEIREERMRAEAAKDYSQAILFMTQAAALVGDSKLAYYEHMLEVFKARLEANSAGPEGSAPPGDGIPDVEAPSSHQDVAPVPQGLSGGAPTGVLGQTPAGPGGPGPAPGIGGPGQGG